MPHGNATTLKRLHGSVTAFEIQVTLISMSLVVGSLWFAPVHPLGLKKIEASNFELISFAFYVSHLVICR